MFGRQVEVPREAGNPSCGGRSGWCLAMRLRAAVDFSLTLEGLKVKKVTSFVELFWIGPRGELPGATVQWGCTVENKRKGRLMWPVRPTSPQFQRSSSETAKREFFVDDFARQTKATPLDIDK